jgi:hypothetical protein
MKGSLRSEAEAPLPLGKDNFPNESWCEHQV